HEIKSQSGQSVVFNHKDNSDSFDGSKLKEAFDSDDGNSSNLHTCVVLMPFSGENKDQEEHGTLMSNGLQCSTAHGASSNTWSHRYRIVADSLGLMHDKPKAEFQDDCVVEILVSLLKEKGSADHTVCKCIPILHLSEKSSQFPGGLPLEGFAQSIS
ncbi:hypothetical protein STEG23_027365, partial [Scotinomys teguina]